MDRRTFLAGVALLAAPLAAAAQKSAKVPRIGILMFESAASYEPQTQAFRHAMSQLGYVEGQNIAYEWRSGEGNSRTVRDQAAELARSRVDVIVAWAARETDAAKQATTTIPIVFLRHADPVGSHHVTSLAKPGENITGVSQMLSELAGKRLELLKLAMPRISRVAVVWNAANPTKALDWKETQVAGGRLGVAVQSHPVRGSADFEGAFTVIKTERPDALMTLDDGLTHSYRAVIVQFAGRERLPAIYGLKEFVDAGGLMTYGVDPTDLFRRGAAYVDKILKGAKPGDLPVEQPTRFELVINLRTAKTLGLTMPPSLLLRADQVVQ